MRQINYNDKEAARFVENIKGWVDINNRFWGNNPDSEHMARYSSCTHMICECGKLMKKGWSKCEECRTKAEQVRPYCKKENPALSQDEIENLIKL